MATAALIGAGGSLLSGVIGGKGASKAARIQAQAIQQGIAEQQREYNQTRSDNLPFLNAGTSAVTDPNGILALLGLSGNDAQAGALSGLKDSPLFTANYNTGVDTILQNAAATGGLRGGNTENSLAQFGSSLFSNVYQSQLDNLLKLAGIGSQTGINLGSLGQQNANATSNLLTQQGNAQAAGILGQTAATTGTINDLSKILQSVTGGGIKK